jgi:hypothetical protein
MPRIRTTQAETGQPATWQQTVAERIRAGKLAPILSNAAGDDLVLGGHAALVQAYAAYSHYTRESPSLAEIAQFRGITDESLTDALALKENYVAWIKSRLFELAEADGAGRDMLDEVDVQFDRLTLARMCDQLGYPHYGDEHSHPLLLLAALDLPIYITTGYHEFMEAAPASPRAPISAAGTRTSRSARSTLRSSTAAMSPARSNPWSTICTGWTAARTPWC